MDFLCKIFCKGSRSCDSSIKSTWQTFIFLRGVSGKHHWERQAQKPHEEAQTKGNSETNPHMYIMPLRNTVQAQPQQTYQDTWERKGKWGMQFLPWMWKIISCPKEFDETPENSPEEDIAKCSATGWESENKHWTWNVSERRKESFQQRNPLHSVH